MFAADADAVGCRHHQVVQRGGFDRFHRGAPSKRAPSAMIRRSFAYVAADAWLGARERPDPQAPGPGDDAPSA